MNANWSNTYKIKVGTKRLKINFSFVLCLSSRIKNMCFPCFTCASKTKNFEF